ncbi:MAG: endonuclease/exonuclease/phosphatase family protein [Balneolaceae bacterium]
MKLLLTGGFPFFLTLLASAFLSCTQLEYTADSPEPITILSYNIRYDNPGDGASRWDLRKEQVVNLIRFHNSDFVGVQEALHHQLLYMDEQLSHMNRIGVGRDDGVEAGEYSAIYYNSNRFELVPGTEETIWLSETPDQIEAGWDAALPRILTSGKFRRVEDGKEFFIFNTHFDHVGDLARLESSKLILETIQRKSGDLPVVVTGDFNVTPESDPYRVITGEGSPLSDAYFRSEQPHLGPNFTFGGFTVRGNTQERRIDYIFVNDQVSVKSHAILPYFRDGRYLSDHLPVLSEIQL